MLSNKAFRYFIPVLIFLAVTLTACDNSTPTPASTTYNPGCSVQNLIAHITQANNTPGPAIIILDYCVYTLTEVDNTISVGGIDIHNGFPVISSEITILGNNAIIEIQKDPGEPFFGHIFLNSSGDLELYDLLISDGNRYLGGAVVNNGGDFFASDVTFIDNLAYPADGNSVARGGAIYSDSGRVRLIDGCHFQSNMAGQTMATGANLGGAIYSLNSTLVVSNSSFLFNHAAGDGGAIYAEKTSTNEEGGLIRINDSEFNENSAQQNGGALALINEIEGVLIASTWFRQHQADNYGGAIYAEGSDVTADFADFKLNTAVNGGGIYTKRPAVGILSSYTSIESEYYRNTASDIGGAIFSENSDLEIGNSDFEDNVANSCGAIRNGGSPSLDVGADDLETAIRISSTSRIIDSSFRGNEALVSNGGGICHVMGAMLVKATEFMGNNAADSGGGMIVHDETEIIGTLFAANNAWNGGALLIGYPILDRSEANTYSNYTFPEYMTFHTSISSSTFATNEASQSGGGIYAHHEGVTSINKSTFQNNSSGRAGGGILRYDGNMFINNSTFSSNSASRGGGIRAIDQVSSKLGIKHTTFAFNIAAETSNGGNVSNVSWGGGALNVGYHTTVENSLIYQNSPMDCQLTNGSNYSASNTYDSDSTCASLTEPNPQIGPLLYNGGATKTHALLPGSPLIDIMPDCAGLTDDQRGVLRPQGSNCDPGAYEFDPANPPEEWPYEEISLEPDDSSDNCDPFDGLDISVFLLNVPADTLVLPLYLKFPDGIPGQNDTEPWKFRALLGEVEAYQCGLQGFEDRLYCMFNLLPSAPGLALDLLLFVDDCEDPSYTQPKVTIPEPKVQCSKDLNQSDCEAAGGTYSGGGAAQPTCNCP